jgi:hypothetical protein
MIEDFPLTSGDVLLLDNEVFLYSRCVRAFADAIGVELLCIAPHTPFCRPIEGVFSIVKRNDHSTGTVFFGLTKRLH